MIEKCKTCGGSGWISGDLRSDATHAMLLEMNIDFEVACPDCDAGRAELAKAKQEASEQKQP